MRRVAETMDGLWRASESRRRRETACGVRQRRWTDCGVLLEVAGDAVSEVLRHRSACT